jgi:carbon monoxide dehydrogenase subunit G
MALWGNKDGAPFGSLTVDAIADRLTFSGSIENYDIQPGDTIIVDTAGSPQHGRVSYVLSSTEVVMENRFSTVLTKTAELQKSPKYTALSDVTAGNILGADLTEVQNADPSVSTLTTPGWLRKYTKTRDGETKTHYEVLVAMSSISEDVENEEFPVAGPADSFAFTTQPQDVDFGSVGMMTGFTTRTMDVAITESGPSTASYDWQISNDSGSTWESLAVGGQHVFNGFLFSQTSGGAPVDTSTTDITITIDPSDPSATGYDGMQVRVVVTKGLVTDTSAIATVSVQP